MKPRISSSTASLRRAVLVTTVLVAGQGLARAQGSTTVVPRVAATQEQDSSMFWIASPFAARHQVIIAAATLADKVGHDLVGFELRRDTNNSRPLAAGQTNLVCSVSTQGPPLDALSESFLANRGKNHAVTISRLVTFPQVAQATQHPAAWGAEGAVTLMFSGPVRYDGGSLCIETQVRPESARNGPTVDLWWPIDASRADNAATVVQVGQSCIRGFTPEAADVDPLGLAPGASARWFLFGKPKLPIVVVAALFGATQTSIDLGAVGAPACTLRLLADFLVPAAFVPYAAGGHGLAECRLLVPADARIVGARLVSQWLVVQPGSNALGVALSNGTVATIGSTVDPEAAFIEANAVDAARGSISYHRLPVLRLLFRPGR